MIFGLHIVPNKKAKKCFEIEKIGFLAGDWGICCNFVGVIKMREFMNKVLVTGGAGFIGYHISEKLVNEGFNVIGLDNINDYYTPDLKYARLSKLGVDNSELTSKTCKKHSSSSHRNYYFIQQDFTNYEFLANLFDEERFDKVIHLGAQAGVRYSLENPHAYIQSNVVGFMNVLECARQHHIKHLVYASSSSVYGNREKTPFSEEDRVDNPLSLYAATKKSNELMAYAYSHLYELPTTGLRFFTVYGSWGRPDMSPIIFAKAITTGKPIKIFNNGNMLRDFTYIDDIVEGIYKVMQHIPDKNSHKPYYNLYNIGNSAPIQLMDFIRSLEDALGKKAIKEYFPMQPGDVYQTYADTSRLQQDVFYKPTTSIQEGVERFAKWYKNQNIV